MQATPTPGGNSAANAFRCPDCGEGIDRMMDALKHMSEAHGADHPGKEPAAVAVAYELVWSDEDE